MSPQLHTQLYGFFQHEFAQMVRSDGYRPIVFTEHGLVVALWMAMASIAAAGSWRRMGVDRLSGIQLPWILVTLLVTLVLCKSLGAISIGALAVTAVAARRAGWIMPAMLTVGALYLLGRIFLPEAIYPVLVELSTYVPTERAQSAMFRVDNEQLLLARTWEQPFLGWVNEGLLQRGPDLETGEAAPALVVDSIWMIAFGTSGLVGLGSLYGLFFLASLQPWLRRGTPRNASDEVLIVATIVGVNLLDSLANGTVIPCVILGMGGVFSAARGATHQLDTEKPRRMAPIAVLVPRRPLA